ncbi:unnamed protein product, partial [Phaeothamnion confervicola]
MSASSRVEGFFGKLKAKMDSIRGLLHLADYLFHLELEIAMASVEGGGPVIGKRSPVEMEEVLEKVFEGILKEVRRRGTQFLYDFVRSQAKRALHYRVEPLHNLPEAGCASGTVEAAAGTAAVAAGPEEEECEYDDLADYRDDRPRTDPGAMARAFAEGAGYDRVF